MYYVYIYIYTYSISIYIHIYILFAKSMFNPKHGHILDSLREYQNTTVYGQPSVLISLAWLLFALSSSTRLTQMMITFAPPRVYWASSPLIPTGLCTANSAAEWKGWNSDHRFQNCLMASGDTYNRRFSASQLNNSCGRITGTLIDVVLLRWCGSLQGTSTIYGSLSVRSYFTIQSKFKLGGNRPTNKDKTTCLYLFHVGGCLKKKTC